MAPVYSLQLRQIQQIQILKKSWNNMIFLEDFPLERDIIYIYIEAEFSSKIKREMSPASDRGTAGEKVVSVEQF